MFFCIPLYSLQLWTWVAVSSSSIVCCNFCYLLSFSKGTSKQPVGGGQIFYQPDEADDFDEEDPDDDLDI